MFVLNFKIFRALIKFFYVYIVLQYIWIAPIFNQQLTSKFQTTKKFKQIVNPNFYSLFSHIFFRDTRKVPSWSRCPCPRWSTGSGSSSCGRPSCTWCRTRETRTRGRWSGNTSSVMTTAPSGAGRKPPGWGFEFWLCCFA